jgi:ribosomal protein S18 acetylase RimI-like enzyme
MALTEELLEGPGPHPRSQRHRRRVDGLREEVVGGHDWETTPVNESDDLTTPAVPADAQDLRDHPVAGPFIIANFDQDRPLHGLSTSSGDAAAWVTRGWDPPHHEWLYVVGSPRVAARLASQLAAVDPSIVGVTAERSLLDALPRGLVPTGDPWDWWSVDQAPAPRVEESKVQFDRGSDAELAAQIQELLDLASPDHWAPPGHPRVHQWAVLRDDRSARLVACAADTRPGGAVPHLASVATHPDYRGRGHAKTVVAALTRHLFDAGASVVTLGMHAHNDAARRVYSDLGFRVRYAWLSGRIPHTDTTNEAGGPTPSSS